MMRLVSRARGQGRAARALGHSLAPCLPPLAPRVLRLVAVLVPVLLAAAPVLASTTACRPAAARCACCPPEHPSPDCAKSCALKPGATPEAAVLLPHRAVSLTESGGGGLSSEAAAEQPSFAVSPLSPAGAAPVPPVPRRYLLACTFRL